MARLDNEIALADTRPRVERATMAHCTLRRSVGEKGTRSVGRISEGTSELTNSIGMKLRLIPPGEYLMGSTQDQVAKVSSWGPLREKRNPANEQPAHRVRIVRPFYLGVHEVTRDEFATFVAATGYKTETERDDRPPEREFTGAKGQNVRWRNPGYPQADSHPVVDLTKADAVAFCEWLGRKEGRSYRLPREAEWEHACRAGTTTLFYTGDDPQQAATVANMDGVADGYEFTAPVGSFPANPFGLYDMSGNVWEMCQDGLTRDYVGQTAEGDPPSSADSATEVTRGGAADCPPYYCRSATRGGQPHSTASDNVGFRVACDAAGGQQFNPPNDASTPSVDGALHTPTDLDRRAAQAMLALGGSVTVRVDGHEETIVPGASLPPEQIELTRVNLNDRPRLTDAELEPLRGAWHLFAVSLRFDPNIGDAGLAYLQNHTTLRELNLSGTRVTDAGMATVEGLVNLQLLAVERTKVTEAGLASIEKLSELQTLWIGNGVHVTDAGLVHLQNLTKLRRITLWGAPLNGTGLKYFKDLKQLEGLGLSDTRITDDGLAHLQSLPQLRKLQLGRTRVTDAGLEKLESMAALEDLKLGKTNVTAAGVKKLAAALPRCKIEWDGGVIAGDAAPAPGKADGKTKKLPAESQTQSNTAAFPQPQIFNGDWENRGDELVQTNDRIGTTEIQFGDPSWTDFDFRGDLSREKQRLLRYRLQVSGPIESASIPPQLRPE